MSRNDDLGPTVRPAPAGAPNSAEGVIARAEKLIALAASPNEHEAASAATQACRIIRDNGLKLTVPEMVLALCVYCGVRMDSGIQISVNTTSEQAGGFAHLKCVAAERMKQR
jgi:hypothetical protein